MIQKKEKLEVVAAREDLFARGAQEERVFELRDVRALDVAEWGVRGDHAGLHEGLEAHEVLSLSQPI